MDKIIAKRVKVVIANELSKGIPATRIAPKIGLPSQAVTHLINGTQKKPGIALVLQMINEMKIHPKWLSGEIGTDDIILYIN